MSICPPWRISIRCTGLNETDLLVFTQIEAFEQKNNLVEYGAQWINVFCVCSVRAYSTAILFESTAYKEAVATTYYRLP